MMSGRTLPPTAAATLWLAWRMTTDDDGNDNDNVQVSLFFFHRHANVVNEFENSEFRCVV